EWGRDLERAFRRWRRRMVCALGDRFPALRPLYPLVRFQPGDVLFLGGNTWGWHDLEKIRRMKRESGLALGILCHDLIPALCPPFFLPAFAATLERFLAFILEEAALILCNSPTTLQDLRGYAGRHGLPLPEARLLPLGHALPLRGASPPKGAPALQPGR